RDIGGEVNDASARGSVDHQCSNHCVLGSNGKNVADPVEIASIQLHPPTAGRPINDYRLRDAIGTAWLDRERAAEVDRISARALAYLLDRRSQGADPVSGSCLALFVRSCTTTISS